MNFLLLAFKQNKVQQNKLMQKKLFLMKGMKWKKNLQTLHNQRKIWKGHNKNAICWAFYCVNDDKELILKSSKHDLFVMGPLCTFQMTFPQKGIFERIFLQHVFKNMHNSPNKLHYLCQIFLNKYELFKMYRFCQILCFIF